MNSFDFGADSLFEMVTQGGDRVVVKAHRKLGRFAETDDVGNVLGAGAVALLLATPAEERLEAEPISEIESADSFGCIKLVTRDRKHVDRNSPDIDGDLTYRLDGVGVEDGAMILEDCASFGDGLGHSGLVVGPHQRSKGREVLS